MKLNKLNKLNNTSSSFILGLLSASIAVFFGKICAVLGQIIGGFYLVPQDFGLIATMMTYLSFVTVLNNSGIDIFLIQRYKNWQSLLPTAWFMTKYLSWIGSFIVCIIGLIFINKTDDKNLFWLIIIGTMSLPIQALSLILKAEHAVAGHYHYQSLVNAITNIINLVIYAIALYFGLGVISFALGLFISSIVNYCLFNRSISKIHRLKSHHPRQFIGKFLLRKLWLIAFGNGLNTMALRVDYLVLSIIATSQALGHYYMGFMMAGTITMLFTTGLQGIIMPHFVKKSDDINLLKKSIEKMIFFSLFLGGVLALIFMWTLSDMVFIAWGTKWDLATIVALGLSVTLPITILRVNMMVLLDTKGLWQYRAIIHGINFCTILIATFIGWHINQLLGVIVAMIIQRIFFSIVIILFVQKIILNNTYMMSLWKLFLYSTPFMVIVLLGLYQGDIKIFNLANIRGFFPLLQNTPLIIVYFIGYCFMSLIIVPHNILKYIK